uniref:non-specific serine/threonine protein kinase n=1 Tax=Chelonoidis abingdonii TaxID=106734 RepID=A0A8C0QP32_CHEAB
MAEYYVKSQLYKGKLHEYCQKNKLQLEYKDVKVEGPPHDRVFTVMVVIGDREYPVATGKNKKEAKEEAAKAAWDSIAQENQNFLYGIYGYCFILYYSYRFSYSCKIGDKIYGEGTGNDKKAAKQAAAKCAYEQLRAQETSRVCIACSLYVKRKASFLAHSSLNQVLSSFEFASKLAPSFSGPEAKYTRDERLIKDFEEIEPIGSGGFGNVFKAKQIIDKKNYAIKRVTCSNKVQREVQALAKLEHENIIRYYTSWTGKDYLNFENSSSLSRLRPDLLCDCLFIQMEFCEKGTLDDWIDEKRGKENYQTESLIKFRQIVTGVEYIHSKGFIHRDLKPLNIFISSEDKIKIGDFGLVTSMTDDPRTTDKGTKSYMSPEQAGDKYGPEVDIFALGLILFEILWIFSTGTEKIKEWQKIRECILPEEFSKNFPLEKYIIEQLLSKDIAKRPSASCVLELLKLVAKNNLNNAHTC